MRQLHKDIFFELINNTCLSRGGKLISFSKINYKSDIKLLCNNKHTFSTTYGKLKIGLWCKFCTKNYKPSINEINLSLLNKNLKCISDYYPGNKAKIDWQCLKCNYIFKASKNSLDKDFVRCSNCFKIEQLNKAQQIAKNKGGQCKTTVYNKSTEKFSFICSNNHEFIAKYNNVIYNETWCPYCSHNNLLSEEICRVYFENIFNDKFLKIRPYWLRKDNGYILELDGYCENLNLAFEHNGLFHYKNNKWNKLKNTQNNDLLKKKLCLNQGIKLIVIPQLFKKISLQKLRQFIIDECNKLNINVPFPNAPISLDKCYSQNIFDSYKAIANNKGGRCVSEFYLGATNEKLIWECDKGHQWLQYPYVIKKGHWCPVCVGLLTSVNILKK